LYKVSEIMSRKNTINRPTLCITLLSTFAEKELEVFNKMLISPYFNNDEQLSLLLKAIKKHALHQDIYDDTIKLRVYNFTYKSKHKLVTNSHKNALNLKMNNLLRLAEKFLSLQKMEQDEWTKLDLLYPQLIERKQYHLFNKHFRKDERVLKEQKIIDESYYERMYKLYVQKVEVQFNTGEIVKEDYVQEVVDFFDLNYLTNKLSSFATIKSLIDTYKKVYYLGSYQRINSLIDFERFKDISKLSLMKSYFEFIKLKTEISYKQFVSNLNKAQRYTSKDELQHLYFVAINYCSLMIRAGNLTYYQNMFAHYNSMINNDLLLQNKLIDPLVLTNIITLACRLNKTEWAKVFIENYKLKIRKNIATKVYSYALGIIDFATKKFHTSHQYFYIVHKTNTSLDYQARIYVLKCMYEERKEYSYEFYQAIKSAANFIYLQKNVPNNRKQGYINFTKLLLQLYNYSFSQGKFKLATIKQNIEAQKLLSDRAWIMEKVLELK